MSIRDILLLASITMNVLLVFLLIVSASDADDSKDQAARLFNTLRARNAALEEARSVIAHKEEEVSRARGFLKRAEEELDKLRKEKESAKNSPFAKDWPHQGALEVMTIPCEAVTLCADYIIPAEHADTQMKNEVITELAKTLYTQAIEFMDVKIQDDPLIYGTKIRGRLVVYKRRD